MKHQHATFLLAAALLALPAATALAQPANAGFTGIVTALRAVPADQRATLVKAALDADGENADELVAALIAAFPTDAAAYTELVVQAVLELSLPNDAKGQVLAAVAESAVTAALAIPPAAVTDLLTTVNDVKAALARVPAEFQSFVAAFITQLTELPGRTGGGDNNGGGDDVGGPGTSVILSDDNP